MCWQGIREFLDTQSPTKIYHDGICLRTDGFSIIDIEANKKNPRAMMVRRLLDRGGILMPTESRAALNLDYLVNLCKTQYRKVRLKKKLGKQ